MNATDTAYPSLSLADGTSWSIAGEDTPCQLLVDRLAHVMGLGTRRHRARHHLLINQSHCSPDVPSDLSFFFLPACEQEAPLNTITCSIATPFNNIDQTARLMEIALVLASQAEARGGVLLHGALASRQGQGVILAGPSDTGKTTAIGRLPAPWKALSDDCSLIVRDQAGSYLAHPWPTWSNLLHADNQEFWNVKKSVPLRAICVLRQSNNDFLQSVSPGRAVCMLNELGEQAWQGLNPGFDRTQKKLLRMQRFNNICALVHGVPTYQLSLTREGPFWNHLEQVLPQHNDRDTP